jgi:hypothetical protein
MNSFQNPFEAQNAYFATNVTRTYEWRIEQLDRMGRRMIKENEATLQSAIARDFKTASALISGTIPTTRGSSARAKCRVFRRSSIQQGSFLAAHPIPTPATSIPRLSIRHVGR